MMIVDEIPPRDPAVRSSKRLTVTPKRMLDDLQTTGFLFESLVAHDLRIYAGTAGAECFHFREAEGRLEVDYVIEDRDGDWIGVEVTMGESEPLRWRTRGRTASMWSRSDCSVPDAPRGVMASVCVGSAAPARCSVAGQAVASVISMSGARSSRKVLASNTSPGPRTQGVAPSASSESAAEPKSGAVTA